MELISTFGREQIKVVWFLSNVLQVPTGDVLTFGDDNFINFEGTGIREAQKAAFVLVAGGLGERLGYNGIKVVWTIIEKSLGLWWITKVSVY